jgi:hypothetical protein
VHRKTNNALDKLSPCGDENGTVVVSFVSAVFAMVVMAMDKRDEGGGNTKRM